MMDIAEWRDTFKAALDRRQQWLGDKRAPLLKDKFKLFRETYGTLYRMLLERRFIIEDPYAKDLKFTELTVPEISPMLEQKKREAFSLRLARYDSQLDYTSTSFYFSLDTLKPEKVKTLKALTGFIEWKSVSALSPSPNTRALAEFIAKIRNNPAEKITSENFDACFNDLAGIAAEIESILGEFTYFTRTKYKSLIRESVTPYMTASEISQETIRRRFQEVLPGMVFIPELVEELINEDYSSEAEKFQEVVLTKLSEGDDEVKERKSAPPPRFLLIDGLNILGSAGGTLEHMVSKIEANHDLLKNRKRPVIEKLKIWFSMLFGGKSPFNVYVCQSIDPVRGPIEEAIEHDVFVEELAKKSRSLQTLAAGGSAAEKLQGMEEARLIELIDRFIRDTQKYHRQLTALDEYFKSDSSIKDRVRGMRSDLSTVKAALSKAIGKKDEYNAILAAINVGTDAAGTAPGAPPQGAAGGAASGAPPPEKPGARPAPAGRAPPPPKGKPTAAKK